MTALASLVDFENLSPIEDDETLVATVLAAAIRGDHAVRARLPSLVDAFDEPYRTIAARLRAAFAAGTFVDQHTLGSFLQNTPLYQQTPHGIRELPAPEAVSLIFNSGQDPLPGQALAYCDVLSQRVVERRREDMKRQAVALAQEYGDRPDRLLPELQRMAAQRPQTPGASGAGAGGGEEQTTELMELFPYVNALLARQSGTRFTGLDSGFENLNQICNGLDTGLMVLAAPPGQGKTTLAWQIACQTAECGRLPVVFVSMEQSKEELRAKALSRLSRIDYRHIMRGRLNAEDDHDRGTLLDAATQYGRIARYLTIVEGCESTTVDAIQEVVRGKLRQLNAPRCLVVVDYLQMIPLRAEDADRVTNTRDRTDLHVSALRRMARDLRSPVLVISAENRAGYSSKRMDVFKESGGIEYSADIAMILTRDKTPVDAEQENCRKLDLNIVKNRNGALGVIKFKFYGARATFVETGQDTLVESDAAVEAGGDA